MKSSRLLLIGIIVIGAAMRVYWNDVTGYSPADESSYTTYARHLLDRGFVRGYPDIVHWFDDDVRMWRYPNPLRIGYLALATTAIEMYGAAEPRALAWLSTLAGIFVIPLLYSFGKRQFNERAGLLAAAFAAVSAIELALGRRALQDEVFCLAIVGALMLVITAMERGRWRDIAAAAAALTAALSIKESTLLLYPAFLAVAAMYKPRWRHAAIFALPPAIHYLAFSLLARDFRAYVRIASHVWGATSSNYVLQYQGGPPHRLLLDLFITSPLVSLLAAAAIALILLGRESSPAERSLALFVVLAVAAMAIMSSKNLRFIVVIDPVVRMLAAWLIATSDATRRVLSGATMFAIGAINAAIELELFHAIFIRGGVYDPVTHSLLQALGAVPRANPADDPPLFFPWICAIVIAAAWLYQNRGGGLRIASSSTASRP
jgi:4-amino-4-deoxy-L-arabinose transferase-like glycosyltransferase